MHPPNAQPPITQRRHPVSVSSCIAWHKGREATTIGQGANNADTVVEAITLVVTLAFITMRQPLELETPTLLVETFLREIEM
jgi:hypothetical protein